MSINEKPLLEKKGHCPNRVDRLRLFAALGGFRFTKVHNAGFSFMVNVVINLFHLYNRPDYRITEPHCEELD